MSVYYVVALVETGKVVYSGKSLAKAAGALEPGTVWGKGRNYWEAHYECKRAQYQARKQWTSTK